MYIFKNALRSIIRSKARSILIFTLVLLISISACIALSVRNSAEVARKATYDTLNVTGQITIDRQKLMSQSGFDREAMSELMSQTLSLEELKEFANSEYVSDYYYSQTIGLNAPDEFLLYESATPSFGGRKDFTNKADLSVIGYSSHEAMKLFVNGENTVSDGAVFEQDSDDLSCLVSNEIAVLNELSLNDTITLVNPQNEEESYTFTICGIFENASTDAYANQIYVSNGSIEKIAAESLEKAIEIEEADGTITSSTLNATPNLTYIFRDPESYEGFCKDVVLMGLDENTYTVSSIDLNTYEESVIPLENLSKFTMMFLIVILLIGGVILIVFNIFTVRERKYEIGVLAAIGMKKSKVAMQFLTEAFMITLFAIVIGSGIGAATSQPVGTYLLKEQITAAETAAESKEQSFGGKFEGGRRGFASAESIGEVQYQDSINTTTDITVLISLMGIALVLTLLASGFGMVSVLRYDPLKILSERS